MELLWVVPAAVAGLAAAALVSASIRANEELRRLRREVGAFGELRPAFVELRSATSDTQLALQALRRRG